MDVRGSLVRAIAALTVAAAAVPVVVYLWIAAHRIGYPYELDWMEGGAVGLVQRVLHGQSLYVAPTLRYVGWAYPPLYTWVSAAVAWVVGLGFLPLRLVSFVSSLVCFGALGRLVWADTGDRVAGFVAVGLFAACYKLTGSWFDVGRLDSMFLALTLLAILYGLRASGVRGGLVLGVLAFLAFFTKQTALVVLAPVLAFLCCTRPRVGLVASGVLVALVVGSFLVLNGLSDGWYRYYVVQQLAGQSWVKQLWLGFWRDDLLAHVWPMAVLALLAVGWWLRERRHAYLLIACVGMLLGAYFSRLHTGGYLNVLMPAYAACAVLGALGVATLRRRFGAVGGLVALAGVVGQLLLLAYPISAEIPTHADRVAGAQLEAALRRLPAPILVVRHPWYAGELDRGMFAQSEGIDDILRSVARRGRSVLVANLLSSLDRYHVQTVVVDAVGEGRDLQKQLAREFRLLPGTITRVPLRALTDTRTAPTLVYVRRVKLHRR